MLGITLRVYSKRKILRLKKFSGFANEIVLGSEKFFGFTNGKFLGFAAQKLPLDIFFVFDLKIILIWI